MPGSVIVAGARTPIGKLGGALSSLSAVELGGLAIHAALTRAGVSPEQVQHVFMGHVIQAGTGQITARQAAVFGGVPMSVPCLTVNKVCLSGLQAIYLADQMISAGEAEVVVAGGMESMSQAPFLLPKVRSGWRFGDHTAVDALVRDALYCSFDHASMGESTERIGAAAGISRQEQDAIALASHERALDARDKLADEIVPVEIAQPKGGPIVMNHDEGVRGDTTADALGKLSASFVTDGAVTAGNSSQISDGAAAVIVTSRAVAQRLNLQPLGEVLSYGMVAGPDASLLYQPAGAIRAALRRVDLDVNDLDVIEINEAFASVMAASMKDLGITHDRVNVNGGAIALGHPVGMSGTRLALTLLHELRRRGGGTGAAGLCGGGGQGDAIVVRSL